jgi:hypothetical protein
VAWDITLVVIDQPLFITCDEPVIVFVCGRSRNSPRAAVT